MLRSNPSGIPLSAHRRGAQTEAQDAPPTKGFNVKYIYDCSLSTTSLIAQTKTYPVYKKTDSASEAQIQALTAASQARQSKRAMDLVDHPLTAHIIQNPDDREPGEGIEIPIQGLNDFWGQNRVIESVVLSAPAKVEKYTKTTYVMRRVRPEALGELDIDEYVAKESIRMSRRAVEWPQFQADTPTPHNMGSAVFIKTTMNLTNN